MVVKLIILSHFLSLSPTCRSNLPGRVRAESSTSARLVPARITRGERGGVIRGCVIRECEGRVKYVGTVGACEDNERGGASMRGCVIRE